VSCSLNPAMLTDMTQAVMIFLLVFYDFNLNSLSWTRFTDADGSRVSITLTLGLSLLQLYRGTPQTDGRTDRRTTEGNLLCPLPYGGGA